MTVDEFKSVFAQIADKKKKEITPVRMFASTRQIYEKLCSTPEFKAYYATHLNDKDYYSYGSDKLFAKLKAKYMQVTRTEDQARKEKENEAKKVVEILEEDVDWNEEGKNFRSEEKERRAKWRGKGREWRKKNRGKGKGWRGRGNRAGKWSDMLKQKR